MLVFEAVQNMQHARELLEKIKADVTF
jgi:hypothetical protein